MKPIACCCQFHVVKVLASKRCRGGLSATEISTVLGVPRTTVRRTMARRSAPTHSRKPPALSRKRRSEIASRRKLVGKLARAVICKSAHRGKTTRSQVVVMEYKQNPSAKSIAHALQRSANISAAVSTVNRDLKALNFRSVVKPRGPLTVVDDRAIRMQFCKSLLELPASRLRRIAFTDEKLCDANQHGSLRDWTAPGEKPLRRAYDQGAKRFMIWGVIGLNLKKFVFSDDSGAKQGADVYVRSILLPCTAVLAHRNVVLQEDNARSHTAASTRRWLQSNGISRFEDAFHTPWPARSSDFNPIEQVWSIVQSRVSKHHAPLTETELRAAWKAELDALSQTTVNRLVLSFRQRLTDAVAANGRTITPRHTDVS